ncbi:hypothetical protein CEXT_518151 [Caerostris extrusa]|uniref:Uncharacterized protein n=1 Tax=Caerostris extrusa TaxID=172846 RepID=A0AAV4SL23_CAEEX|nr:hypothetical protein CEXT_518151 [Caerostris extrusa]
MYHCTEQAKSKISPLKNPSRTTFAGTQMQSDGPNDRNKGPTNKDTRRWLDTNQNIMSTGPFLIPMSCFSAEALKVTICSRVQRFA